MASRVELEGANDTTGAFVRSPSAFREWVTSDGSSGLEAEPGRYHLYVSPACPWSHRTIIVRALKQLTKAISLSEVDPVRDERGWAFGNAFADPINGFELLREAYQRTDPAYEGRITVPVLWDRTTQRIVNNESHDIVRMLNSEFAADAGSTHDLYPRGARAEIDALNERIYSSVNNGVYRAGFARSQQSYEQAFEELFESLDWLEDLLSGRRFLTGGHTTEADWRLFVTLVRFDAVYYLHFKCNKRRLVDYPNLSAYARDLYQVPQVAETVDFGQIKRHYYLTHSSLNPRQIVPLGPELDFEAPHNRHLLG